MSGKNSLPAISLVVVACCLLKFLADGVTFTLFGHVMNLGHVDSLAYVSILTPVLGAHTYVHCQGMKRGAGEKVDNPDAT